jgi:hypothetical protein
MADTGEAEGSHRPLSNRGMPISEPFQMYIQAARRVADSVTICTLRRT